MVARFLHYYPQYELRDLTDGKVSMGEFNYLMGGMLDVVNPDATETAAERVARATREAHEKATANSGKRSW